MLLIFCLVDNASTDNKNTVHKKPTKNIFKKNLPAARRWVARLAGAPSRRASARTGGPGSAPAAPSRRPPPRTAALARSTGPADSARLVSVAGSLKDSRR